MMKKLLSLSALLVTMLSMNQAWAHGDEEHEEKGKHVISTDQEEFGREGDPKKVTRTIKVDMADTMRFTPADLTIKQGEVVRIVLTNKGKINHEMVMGSEKGLKEHSEAMKKFPGMEHSAPYMVHVGVGKSKEVVWEFNKPGTFLFGCLMPGHYEAGMVGRIKVAAK
ncbi:cupredoxin domain-containing protein [Chitinimonas naiadis]